MRIQNRKILVTGANGFVGRALIRELLLRGRYPIVGSTRREFFLNKNVTIEAVGEINAATNWSVALSGIKVIVHTAGRAHVQHETNNDPFEEYRRVNVEGTLNLARQAALAGVERFIFISSIGVNGNLNTCPFTAQDVPHPVEAYALSKWQAEQELWKVQKDTGMEIVIIRPPLIYGPNAPGNFGTLVRWVERGIPLPLGAVHNKRSLVSLDNLIDLIVQCIDHPAAVNETFLVGDGEDLSTTEILRMIARVMGRPARLIPVPVGLLRLGASLVGRKAKANKVLSSLQVDISHTRRTLDWEPPLSLDEGFQVAVGVINKEK